jgi:sugar (pentulose or hexulose) kinase
MRSTSRRQPAESRERCLLLPFLYGSNAGLEMTSGFYGMQALHTRAHLLQAV